MNSRKHPDLIFLSKNGAYAECENSSSHIFFFFEVTNKIAYTSHENFVFSKDVVTVTSRSNILEGNTFRHLRYSESKVMHLL